MPSTLILRLPDSAQHDAEWLVVDETGMPAGSRQSGPLASVQAAARGLRIVALVPATQILLAEPELPPGSGTKLLRAVPFALEEQLTEDIDQLHFAIGRRKAGGAVAVAVVARTVMQAWTGRLSEAGITAAAMYADMALMPDNPGHTVLWLEADRLAVRRPGGLPCMIEIAPVTEALVFGGVIADPAADAEAEPKAPENALLYLTREDWTRVQAEVEGLMERFESLRIQLLPDGPLPWLGRELASADAVNLLQGDFAVADEYAGQWRRWRTAAVLAGVLLGTHVAAQALQIRQANKETAALDAEIAQVFSATMPAEAPQNPRRQMQSRLDRIRKASAGPQYFLHGIQALSAGMAGLQQTSIDALSFREQTLDMKITAANVETLSKLSQAVARQGLACDIQSSTPVPTGVEAHMQIRAAAAGAKR